MGRTDDIINVARQRLSNGAMEKVLVTHSDVAECAVTSINDPIKGEVPIGFVVLKARRDRNPIELEHKLVKMVREKAGPIASFKKALTIARLPKTRSGMILHRRIKKLADRLSYTFPPTIDDPAILDEIREALQEKDSQSIEQSRNRFCVEMSVRMILFIGPTDYPEMIVCIRIPDRFHNLRLDVTNETSCSTRLYQEHCANPDERAHPTMLSGMAQREGTRYA